jgi:hypothetical protein
MFCIYCHLHVSSYLLTERSEFIHAKKVQMEIKLSFSREIERHEIAAPILQSRCKTEREMWYSHPRRPAAAAARIYGRWQQIGAWAVKTTPEAAPRGGDRPAARPPRLPADILSRGELPRPRTYRCPRRSLSFTVAPPWSSTPATRTARGAHVPPLLLARTPWLGLSKGTSTAAGRGGCSRGLSTRSVG